MQIVSIWDNFHDISNPVCWENKNKSCQKTTQLSEKVWSDMKTILRNSLLIRVIKAKHVG